MGPSTGHWGKRKDMLVHEVEPFNAETQPAVLVASDVTAVEAFYSRNHGAAPAIDASTWSLTVDGLVERSLTLSLEQLRETFEQVSLTATMQCAGNRRAGLIEVRDIPGEDPWRAGAIGTARWTGVRLRDVLVSAGIRDGATDVAFEAPDVSDLASPSQTYGSSIGLAKALAPETLVAWAMNDTALTRIHGAPVRIVVPGYIGARSVKWVQRIHVQAQPSENYFQATAYRILEPEADPSEAGPGDGISLGPWSLNCDILAPRPGPASSGPMEIAGYALAAEHRTVARVEVSLDGGGTWVQAVLDEPVSEWTWRRWRVQVTVPTGRTEIIARAWDDSGALQPQDPASLWNPKGYANTSWAHVEVQAH